MYRYRLIGLSLVIFGLCLSATTAFSQDQYEREPPTSGRFYCSDCRSPSDHYVDFGNFAFNALYGSDPWIGGTDGAESSYFLTIVNPLAQTVGVHVDLVPSLFPFPDNTLEIIVVLPDGVVVGYDVLTSSIGSDLMVGDSNAQTPTGSGSSLRYGTLGTNAYYTPNGGTTAILTVSGNRRTSVTCDPACC